MSCFNCPEDHAEHVLGGEHFCKHCYQELCADMAELAFRVDHPEVA